MNNVSPAAVSTRILTDFTTAFGEKVAQHIALVGRPGLPEEIAKVIVFLASKNVTGSKARIWSSTGV